MVSPGSLLYEQNSYVDAELTRQHVMGMRIWPEQHGV